MSRLQRKRGTQWARYFNRYAHVPDVHIGGGSASRAIWREMYSQRSTFLFIRRQAKRQFGGRS